MALNKKPGTFYERFLNDLRVNNHRKLILKINYHKGLSLEYNKKFDAFIEKETKLIETYYQEDTAPLTKRLEGISKIDEKRERKLERFNKKAYWSRRRYKTSQSRKVDESTLNNLMESFDQNQKKQKELFIENLEKKYINHNTDPNKTDMIKNKIAALDKKKQDDLNKMNKKAEKLKEKVVAFQKRNQAKIKRMESKNETHTKNILLYNAKRQKEDAAILETLEQKYKVLTDHKNNSEHVNEKKLQALENKIQKIKSVKHLLDAENIHLSINRLKMYFGGVKAVDDLSFNVKKGEIFGLIGPNGAGKTTVFNCITQFYKATSGNMILRNKENHIVDLYKYKTHDMINEGIARSFQNVELIWELTVLDNLMVAAHTLLITSFADHMMHTPKLSWEEQVIRSKGYRILQELGIEEYAFRSPYGLPYGVLKKVELARTLMTDPSMIILDEPAAGLNDAETEDLAKVIKKINKDFGITIFLVEHDMGLVMSICDRICAISFGRRIGLGTPKEIQQNPEVRKAYLGDDSDEN